jgi:DNA-binding transcriptional ArsR family regulator
MTELSWSEIRQAVRERANNCCEYCQTCGENSGQVLHIDHIDPNGGNSLDNLCLACWNCNTRKSVATHAIDPETQKFVTLFNPRQDTWTEHFEWTEKNSNIRGLTARGWATIERLKMNHTIVVTHQPLDAVFAALSDPTRRAILERLTDGEATILELAEPFNMSLPAISKHIKILEKAGLIAREKVGRENFIKLMPTNLQTAADYFSQYAAFWEAQFDALEAYFDNLDEEDPADG